MKKNAFTMIELIFVIIVLGILASLAMGRMDRDLKQEAADTVLSHIRLAQQMALNDNKHLPNSPDKWQKGYWEWRYTKCSNGDIFYQVRSDRDLKGNFDQNEAAIDPVTGKYIFMGNSYCTNRSYKGDNNSPNVALTENFGVSNITRSRGCRRGSSRRYISFDYLGRPHHGKKGYSLPNFKNIMTDDCNLTFTMSTDQDNDGIIDTFNIIIEDETGYSYIEGQEN